MLHGTGQAMKVDCLPLGKALFVPALALVRDAKSSVGRDKGQRKY